MCELKRGKQIHVKNSVKNRVKTFVWKIFVLKIRIQNRVKNFELKNRVKNIRVNIVVLKKYFPGLMFSPVCLIFA